MPQINLLYVITKLELGGAQKQLLSLIGRLDKNKFRIFLFTAKEGLLLPDAVSIDGLTIKKSIWLERAINPAKDLFALIEIYLFIKKNKIEFIHTHSSKAGILGRIAARLAGVKLVIHTVHGWSFNDFQPILKKLCFIWLERFTARFTNKIIVVSDYDLQAGIKKHIGIEAKYEIIRYGIDYAEFNSNEEGQDLRKALGIGNNDLVVGMVACLKPQKAPQDFIKLAFLVNKELPEVKFILVGDGVLRVKIKKLISEAKVQKNVFLTGWSRDIPRVLSTIDVFVLTSLWEGLPISVLEAMAFSKPVISTDTGGVREVIFEGRTGFLVPRHDMKAMAEKIIGLLRNDGLRKQIGLNVKDSLKDRYCLENMVRDTENLYCRFF
jgi:glycosyltransferase involved in cell wall biosynthesis